MNNDWIYVGIFLDDKSRKKLINLYPTKQPWKAYYDHMTVVYNDGSPVANAVKMINEPNIGKKFKLKLVGSGISEKAYAVQVELPKGLVCVNKITHITLATNPITGGNAVDSNYITNWSKVYQNIYLTGTMKVFESTTILLGNSKVAKITVDEANIY